jgi:hypothetical protein
LVLSNKLFTFIKLDMSAEDTYIKNIENGIRGLRLRTKTPSDSNVGTNLNHLKMVNEGMYEEYLEKYKKALKEYNKHSDANQTNK